MNDLKPFLDEVYKRFHTVESIEHDPLYFPRRYSDRTDIEAAALIASAFAFGRVAAFMPVISTILSRLGDRPGRALTESSPGDLRRVADGIVYRFAGPDNVAGLLTGAAELMRQSGSLEPVFSRGLVSGGTVCGLLEIAGSLRSAATVGDADPGFLVPVGDRNSPMKRMCMFLRWMVRDDGVDLGLWKSVHPSELLFPLDVHVFRISTLLGLIPHRKNDAGPKPGHDAAPRMKDSIIITEALRRLDPDDPVKYDFAISHLGISGSCRGTGGPGCQCCPLGTVCFAGISAR